MDARAAIREAHKHNAEDLAYREGWHAALTAVELRLDPSPRDLYRNPVTGELVMVPGAVLDCGAVIVASSARNAHEWILLTMEPGRVTDVYATRKCARPGDGSDAHSAHWFDSIATAIADYLTRP
jgi:hypothetical protein